MNSATLSNLQGFAGTSTTFLAEANGFDLLSVGRRINRNNVGISPEARARNQQIRDQSASSFNQIFSLSGVEFGTNETLQQKILAIRAGLPETAVRRDLFEDPNGGNVDEEV